MSQANVYTANVAQQGLNNVQWYTDKCSISTGNTAVFYNVYIAALNYIPANGVPQVATAAVGNLFYNPNAIPNVQVPANSTRQIYVGAGNYLTITGNNFTAQELGTASSATRGVIGVNG
jgi:hypothetical protein